MTGGLTVRGDTRVYTLGDMAKELGRSAGYLKGLQIRFVLPVCSGETYSKAYLDLLRKIVFLRVLGISEEAIVKLWQLEKKLMELLHADEVDSPTWFLDECGKRTHPRRRLLLTNYDVGADLFSRKLQLALPLKERTNELFQGHEMGEDALRVLESYLKTYDRIQRDASLQIRPLRAAATWAGRLPQKMG